MRETKTVGMSFRVTPRLRDLLQAAAARERRSLTNMLEVLLDDYCRRHGLNSLEASSETLASTQRCKSQGSAASLGDKGEPNPLPEAHPRR
jgi:hypothetical protein